MALKSGIFNSVNGDRRYKAEDFAGYFASFIGNGVFPNPSTGFQVIANNNMTVTLKAGKAWINGYFITNDADYVLTLDVADGVLNRIDRIVLQLNYLNREITPIVKKGTFASSPVATVLKRDADAYEIALADVYVTKGALSISQANVTDQRLNTSLCGIVAGVVNQIDTEGLFAQYGTAFQEWFDSIKGLLSGDIAGNLSSQISTINQSVLSHLADDATLTKKGHVQVGTNIDVTGGVISVKNASTTAKGVVQLSSSTSSTSTTTAATSSAVKSAMDKANAAETPSGAQSKIEQDSYKTTKSVKDTNGIFTTIEHRRKSDNTLMRRAVLSGGTSPQYTTQTVTYYAADGTTVTKTDTFALSYDADGDLIGSV